jgi:hypothetical protein
VGNQALEGDCGGDLEGMSLEGGGIGELLKELKAYRGVPVGEGEVRGETEGVDAVVRG